MTRKGWTVLALVAVLVAAGIFAATAVGKEAREKGFLGVVLGEVTSDIAADYGVQPGAGVLVAGVTPGSPADEAGLRENDVIIRVNKMIPTGPEECRKQIGNLKPDDKVELVYLRGGKEKTVEVTLGKRSDDDFEGGKEIHREFRFQGPPWEWHRGKTDEPKEKLAYAGIVTQEIRDGLATYFKVEKGALIAEVVKDSPAERAGLKAGDVILKIGTDAVEDEGDVRRLIRDRKPGAAVDFQISRDGNPLTISVTLGEQIGTRNEPLLFGFNGKDGKIPGVSKEEMEQFHKELQNLKIEIESLPDIDIDMKEIHVPDIKVRVERQAMVHADEKDTEDQHKSPQRLRDRLSAAFQRLSREVDRLIDRAFV